MYKKVDFDLGVATIDGKTIGMEKDNFNGTIVFAEPLIVWTATGETVQIADIIGLQTRTMDIT